MRATRRVVRAASAIFAVAVVIVAYRARPPLASYSAEARIEIAGEVSTVVPVDLTSLERLAAAAQATLVDGPGANALTVTVCASDPLTAAQTVNRLVETFVRDEQSERARRAAPMLKDTAAELQAQGRLVRDFERRLAATRDSAAAARRQQQTVASRLRDLDRSLDRAPAAAVELQPLYDAIRSGHPLETLSVVQNTLQVQGLKGRLAVLEVERTALLERYGPAHPTVEQRERQQATVRELLSTEIQNVATTVMQDYEGHRPEREFQAERDRIVREPVPL